MTSLKSFTKFPELPPEIQLQIWESTMAAQPAMHVFDVCVPPHVTESAASTGQSPTSGRHSDGENEGSDSSNSKGQEIYLDEATDTLYLTPVATTGRPSSKPTTTATQTHSSAGAALFRTDPSMYTFRSSLAATCIDARRSLFLPLPMADPRNNGDAPNTIFIGAPSMERACARVTYDNMQDVLHLRFLPPAFRSPGGGEGGRCAPPRAPLSAIFESIWSQELSSALNHARRVAIDVSQLWPRGPWSSRGAVVSGVDEGQQGMADEGELGVLGEGDDDDDEEEEEEGEEEEGEGEEGAGGHDDGGDDASLIMQDIAFLACTVQHNLEVLYLVDYCAGRCGSHPASSLGARDLMERSDDGLYRSLGNGKTWQKEKTRKPDVIQGVGMVWREIFDLEKLGWDEEHPGFVFAEMFTEVVKIQQGNWMGDDSQECVPKEKVKFQGVRVLVAEDEHINGHDSVMILQCASHEHGTK